MMLKRKIVPIIFALVVSSVSAQNLNSSCCFESPMVVDSSSTIIIPTRYHTELLSSNKMALLGDYYANILFYNFVTDTYKRLFENDTYIVGFDDQCIYCDGSKRLQNITSDKIFYRVKNVDLNKSGAIDSFDPTILYVSDLYGNNLKALTSEQESVVSFEIFEDQNFALIKIQRDLDKDGDFQLNDKDFYYVKLDLITLQFGTKIEIK